MHSFFNRILSDENPSISLEFADVAPTLHRSHSNRLERNYER